MLEAIKAETRIFNDDFASFFAVSCDTRDEKERRIEHRLPGFHVIWDPDTKVADLFGLTGQKDGRKIIQRVSYVLDCNLRVLFVLRVNDLRTHAREVINALSALTPHSEMRAEDSLAPILILPRVFEPDFCKMLVGLYEKGKSHDSGTTLSDPKTGMTIVSVDHSVKKRRDVTISNETVRQQINARLSRRLVPEVRKVFQFHATRIERYIVARYDAKDGGFFRQHRDNLTKGTAYRRFAVTINLNAEDYEGGDLCFAEYGRRPYRAPTGGAAVFSCSLLHEAMPVTQGTRYVFLPFLYDEAAAAMREQNLKFMAKTA